MHMSAATCRRNSRVGKGYDADESDGTSCASLFLLGLFPLTLEVQWGPAAPPRHRHQWARWGPADPWRPGHQWARWGPAHQWARRDPWGQLHLIGFDCAVGFFWGGGHTQSGPADQPGPELGAGPELVARHGPSRALKTEPQLLAVQKREIGANRESGDALKGTVNKMRTLGPSVRILPSDLVSW
jgi:hypothetical protein